MKPYTRRGLLSKMNNAATRGMKVIESYIGSKEFSHDLSKCFRGITTDNKPLALVEFYYEIHNMPKHKTQFLKEFHKWLNQSPSVDSNLFMKGNLSYIANLLKYENIEELQKIENFLKKDRSMNKINKEDLLMTIEAYYYSKDNDEPYLLYIDKKQFKQDRNKIDFLKEYMKIQDEWKNVIRSVIHTKGKKSSELVISLLEILEKDFSSDIAKKLIEYLIVYDLSSVRINKKIATLITASLSVVDYYQIINQFLMENPVHKMNCNSFKEVIIEEMNNSKRLREFIDKIEERSHDSRYAEIHKINRKLEVNIRELKAKMSKKFWNEYVKQEFEKTLTQKLKESTLYAIHKMDKLVNRILNNIWDILEISKDASIKNANDEYLELIKRKCESIFDEFNVKQEDIIGSSHEFDPRKHEMIDGKPTNNVIIIEPALIRVQNGEVLIIRKAKVKSKEG